MSLKAKACLIVFGSFLMATIVGVCLYFLIPKQLNKDIEFNIVNNVELIQGETKEVEYFLNRSDATVIVGVQNQGVVSFSLATNKIILNAIAQGQTKLNICVRLDNQKKEQDVNIVVLKKQEDTNDDTTINPPIDNDNQSGEEIGESGDEEGEGDESDASEGVAEIEIEGRRGCEIEGREIKITGSSCYINIIAEVSSKEEVEIESELKIEETQMSGLVYKIEVGGTGRYTLKIKIGNRETEYTVVI